MIQSLANFLRRRQQKWNSGQMLSILAHSSLEVHCSYRLKFFVSKNHLRSSSPSNCSLLCSRFAQSCSPRPFQRSKYTEGVALRMRICIAVRRLSRKCVQKKNTPEPGGYFFWTRFENLAAKPWKINDRVVPILVAIRNWNDVISCQDPRKSLSLPSVLLLDV